MLRRLSSGIGTAASTIRFSLVAAGLLTVPQQDG